MPTKSKSPSTAAVEEAKPSSPEITFEFEGQSFTYRRKRLGGWDWRRHIQAGRYEAAIEWLIGTAQMDKFAAAIRDEDGDVPEEKWFDFMNALGESAGAGNS